jgi:TonB family protein
MLQTPSPVLEEAELPVADLRLLIEPEPWYRAFAQNLRAFFQPSEVFNQQSTITNHQSEATFWPDVFVERRLPWRRFVESGACHVLALTLVWAGSRLLALQPRVAPQPAFTHADVVYYTPSEYLPPLDTRRSDSVRLRKADPEYSAQPIISVPREADNRSQTIVTPPDIQLQHDVALPNIVAWRETPQVPIGPVPVVPASEISHLAPQMERSVIAPPPDLRNDVQPESQKTFHAPEPAVVAPPPAVEAGSTRRLGDLNIAHSSVIAPAPQLSLDEQRAVSGRSSTAMSRRAPEVIAPPPSLAASGRSRSGGGVIALSLHPAVDAPPDPPPGNRRGNFAATPEGHRGASGEPGASAGSGKENATGSGGKKNSGELPSGLYVGKTPNATSTVAGNPAPTNPTANTINPNLIASVRLPRVSARMQPEGESKLSDEERAVFGSRKFYSLSLNMPNLNSAGGSWIVRFAALKPDAGSGHPSSGDPSPEDLSAPSATRKVDPAYPQELMRQNVGGTVILCGIIHANGTVGSVRVLRSVDDRIDQFAGEAIAKWQFHPATKNGAPVDVEATFSIPFRPARVGSSF